MADAPGLRAQDEAVGGDAELFSRERFLTRARALFYARLTLLAMGLGILVVPAWAAAFGIETLRGIAVFMVMVAYSAVNFVFLERPVAGRVVTFITLCADLVVLVYLIMVSGGLHSPLLATQLLFTALFVLLFPRPLAIIPPLLTFPVVAQIQELVNGGHFAPTDLFVLVWFSGVNCVMVYLLVYLNARDEGNHRELMRLQRSLQELAVVEERNRLAREIHDGLGGSLSSLILQAEYLQGLARDEALKQEISELKSQAEESIDELRRSLALMREDFDLVRSLEDACRKFEARARGLKVAFVREGRERPVSSEAALTMFRVLQESLTNVVRHAGASRADVRLAFDEQAVALSVRDDGKGFDVTAARPPGHYGLLNLQERAARLGGSAKVDSRPGAGTTVVLEVPAAAAAAAREHGARAA